MGGDGEKKSVSVWVRAKNLHFKHTCKREEGGLEEEEDEERQQHRGEGHVYIEVGSGRGRRTCESKKCTGRRFRGVVHSSASAAAAVVVVVITEPEREMYEGRDNLCVCVLCVCIIRRREQAAPH